MFYLRDTSISSFQTLARERKIKLQDATKLKKNISWQLSSYKQDIKDYRQIVGEITRGTPKGHIRSLLQSRKNLRLKCHGHETEVSFLYVTTFLGTSYPSYERYMCFIAFVAHLYFCLRGKSSKTQSIR